MLKLDSADTIKTLSHSVEVSSQTVRDLVAQNAGLELALAYLRSQVVFATTLQSPIAMREVLVQALREIKPNLGEDVPPLGE